MIVRGWPLEFSGTIKGMKPDTAKKLFNFDLPEDAKGVTFVRRGKDTIIKAYYPEYYKSKSADSEKTKEYMEIINKIGHTHLSDIIRPIWDKPARAKKFYCGFNYFASKNLKRIREGADKIQISIGDLEPPEVKEFNRNKEAVRIKIKSQINPNIQTNNKAEPEVGIFVLNPRICWFKHIAPKVYGEEVYLRVKSEEAVLFLYNKFGDRYSVSVSVKINSNISRKVR